MVDQVKDNKKWSISMILIVVLSISSIFLLGFRITKNKTPNEMYVVYLEGKKIDSNISYLWEERIEKIIEGTDLRLKKDGKEA